MLHKQPLEFYSEPLAGVDHEELQGKLIVIEGPDAVGRSTQVTHDSTDHEDPAICRKGDFGVDCEVMAAGVGS